MGEYQKHHLPALRPIRSSIDGLAEVPFDHAEYRLDLPSLAITFLWESPLHLATVFTSERLVCLSSMCGRYCCSDLTLLTREPMVGFTVIAGVGQQMLDAVLLGSRDDDVFEHVDVRAGTASCDGREDQMTVTVRRYREFGPTVIMRMLIFSGLPGVFSPNIVLAGMSGFQPGGVYGCQTDSFVFSAVPGLCLPAFVGQWRMTADDLMPSGAWYSEEHATDR